MSTTPWVLGAAPVPSEATSLAGYLTTMRHFHEVIKQSY